MKKFVSLLLALVMALSLCVPAYAGSTTGTVALRLTGSAADQVANLKSGQRVTADSDVVVRLNVQNDPTAAEYTVALNGKAVEADHSTSQYHFYYLPAAQLAAGTATLSVDAAAVELEGAGTEASPYLIYTAAQLGEFRDKVNTANDDGIGDTGAWAKLMDDITLTGDWTPIKGFTGTYGAAVPYTGTFDGNGHTISGLNVNVAAAGADSAGLFGTVGEGAVIKDLTISGSTIKVNKAGYAGAFIGQAKGAVTLTNCHTTDTVTVAADTTTTSDVGGLVGGSLGGLLTMTECSNAAAVTGGAASATKGTGGLVGQAENAFTIQCSFNAGSVSSAATSNVGGLVGYASGTVSSPVSQLTDVYNAGAVAGTTGSNVGGFIGKKNDGFAFKAVTNAYTRAAVTAGDAAGYAVVGNATEEITLANVYKLDEAQEDVGGHTNNSEAAVKTADELKALASTLGENWKEDTEDLNEGFPVLTWQQKDSGEKPGVLQGDGTESNPYQIPDAKALNTFRNKVNEDNGATKIYAKLTDDITLTDDAWTPIETFIGELDGQDHTISGIKINATGDDQGFIRFTKGDAVIKNLTIANSSIAATQTRVGAFVGKANAYTGSLTLINCHTAKDVTVSAKNGIAGGLVGQTDGNVTITNCSNRAKVTSTGAMNGIGGLVGHAYNGSGKTLAISQSFNAGEVTGAKFTGGLVGQVSNDACTLTMTDVYNMGTASNTATGGAVGGLVGYLPVNWGNKGTTTISNAYSASANALLGKLDANKPTTLDNVYKLDGQETVGTLGDGAELTGDAAAKTAEEMKEKTFGKTTLGGSFTRDFLEINNGYPVLKWQNGDAQEPVTLEGEGTKDKPYLIWDASEMAAFRDKANSTQPGACATLMADIDLQSEAATKNWTPIGMVSKPYTGVFNGNGHTISGIQIHNTTEKSFYAGLFGWTAQSTTSPVIKDLTIANSTIINEADNGDAAALLCYGGGVIENCHTAADVTVKGAKVAGGLVGTFKAYYAAETPSMTNCSNRAAVTQMGDPDFGVPKAGGLIGYAYSVVMTGCFNAGPVSAETTKDTVYAGGLIGNTDQDDSTLKDVYNVGDITAPNSTSQSVGGLVGQATKRLDITNAYQCSTVANKSGKGGVVGYYRGGATQALMLQNVYKTGDLPDYLAKGDSSKFTNKGIAVTVEQLKGFTDELGMNFVADLTGEKQLNNGLPILDWQDPDASASDILYISVKDVERKARLGSNGASDPETPTVCEVNIDCGLLSTNVADTIQLAVDTSKNKGTVKMGTGLSKDGTITGEITENGNGVLTADGLYFAKHPAKQTRTVYVAYTRDGETRYYQININRSARSGVAYGSAISEPATSEDAPYIASTYDTSTGYLTGTVNAGYQQFTDGEVSSQTTYGMAATTGTMAENGFTVGTKGSSGQKVTFARPGRYWKTTASASTEYDRVPLAAWWGSEEVAQKYLDKANALKSDAIYAQLSDEFKTAFEKAIAAVEAGKGNIGKTLYLSSEGYAYTGTVPARDALGAVMTGEYELEEAENQLLNLMDIISTWKMSASLGADKYTALTRLTEKLNVLSVLNVTDDASLAKYETNRGYVWTMLQATNRTDINTVLAKAGCSTIVDGTPVTPTDKVNLWVGKTGQQVYITSENGSVDPANPKALTYDFAIPADGKMEQIFITLPENVQAGTSLSKTGTLSGALEVVDGKYTNTNLFFYDQPKAQSKTLYLVFTDNDTNSNYYYKVTATRAAKTGLNIGGTQMAREEYPISLISSTLSSGKAFAAMTAYQGAATVSPTADDETFMGSYVAVKPQWSEDTNALVYADSSNVYVKRHGWYWMPVSYTRDGATATGYLPMVARPDNSSAAKYINAAKALESSDQYSSIPDEAKTMMADAITAVQAQIDENTLASAWNYDGTKVNRRNYYGGPLRGADQVELATNTIRDLTAIFTKWGENAELANYQWQGYQIIAQMDGVFAAKDIASGADRDLYQKIREAKWALLQTTDLDSVNAVLLGLNLSPIGAETSLTIGSADELAAFASRVNNGETNLDAKLTADISLEGKTWTPITGYTGTFDGSGHTISGLNTFDASATTYIGLFGTTGTGAVIKNLTIDNSTITGTAKYMGAIVAYGEDTLTLENCQTTKDVTVTNTSGGVGIGGLVGAMKSASADDEVQPLINMDQCSNAAAVSGKFNTQYAGVGGLIGAAPNGGTITNSCNNGAVTNNQANGAYVAAGGLVGAANRKNKPAAALTLTNVYNSGTVWAKSGNGKLAGGLVGDATWGAAITNAYSTMSVKTKGNGTGYGGVIVGTVSNPCTITNVYAELIRGQNQNCKLALAGDDRISAVEKMFSDTDMPKVCDKLGEAFKQDTTGTISGYKNYPVLAWQNAAAVEPEPEPESAKVTVTIGGQTQEFTLSTEDEGTADAPKELTVTAAAGSGSLDRIYFSADASVVLGTKLTSDKVADADKLIAITDKGSTAEGLYFYRTPVQQKQFVYAVFTDSTARAHYYKLTVTRPATEGYALGEGGFNNGSVIYSEVTPGGTAGTNSFSYSDGYYSVQVSQIIKAMPTMSQIYAAMGVYQNGTQVSVDETTREPLAQPDWTQIVAAGNGMIKTEFNEGFGSTQLQVARPGSYWFPVSLTYAGQELTGMLPMEARASKTAVNAYVSAANELLSGDKLNDAAKAMLNTALKNVNDNLNHVADAVYLAADGTNTYDSTTKITARNYYGAPLTGAALLEKDINTVVDMTAIFSNTDATQAGYQWQAYQQIMNKTGGVHAAIDIKRDTDRTLYQNIRQAKWDLLKTTDLEGVNAILTKLGLETITAPEPEYTLGDINADGTIADINDVTRSIWFYNGVQTPNETELKAADINGNGVIDIYDVTQMIWYYNGVITEFNSSNS